MSTLQVTNINSNTASTPPVINDSGGTQVGTFCRAWVNFNGTGTVSANQTIRASFNVSSVFKNGTGDYTVNFTTALVDANYCVNYTGGYKPGIDARTFNIINSDTAQTTSSVRVRTIFTDASVCDTDRCNVAIFR